MTPTIPTKLAINISLTLGHFMTTALNVIKCGFTKLEPLCILNKKLFIDTFGEAYVTVCIRRSENSLQDSFHCVGSKTRTQVISVGGKHFHH